MDFYGCYFEYAGELSRKYGLIIANVETKQNVIISGKYQSISIFNKRSQTRHDLGNTYDEAPLSFEMEVFSEVPIDGEGRRRIQKWLFNQIGYQKLYVDPADAPLGEVFDLETGRPKREYLNCKFVNPEKIEGNGGIVGYKFDVVCDSRMAWQDPMHAEFMLVGGSGQMTDIPVALDTDMLDYTYPKITITTGNVGGKITLANLDDDASRITTFSNMPPNTQFVINGIYNYVSDGFYENFIDRNFPRLLDGSNDIRVTGDVVAIIVEWQNMRYL